MKDSELQRKEEKASVYATHPDLFKLLSIKLEMRSQHGLRYIIYANGKWSCTCDFFQERETCSHTMAAKQILTSMPLMGTFNEEIHIDDSN